jgi:radical SAM superfamily enzyme
MLEYPLQLSVFLTHLSESQVLERLLKMFPRPTLASPEWSLLRTPESDMNSLIAWEQFSKGLTAVQAATNAISLST